MHSTRVTHADVDGSRLIVCGDVDYLGRLGGEGLRKRLAKSQVN